MSKEVHEIRIQHGWSGDPYRAFCTCGWESPHGRTREIAAQQDGDEHLIAVAT